MLNDTRHALARQCCGIKCRSLARQPSVDGHTFSRLDLHDVAHLDFGRFHGLTLAVTHDHGMVGPDGNQRLDIAPRAAHGTVLQQLADAIQRHHCHGLGILTDGKGADAGHRHQQEFAEQFALTGLFNGFAQHTQPRGQPCHGKPNELYPLVLEPLGTRCVHDDAHHQQDKRQGRFPPAHFLLVVMFLAMSIGTATAAVAMAFFLVMMIVLMCHNCSLLY